MQLRAICEIEIVKTKNWIKSKAVGFDIECLQNVREKLNMELNGFELTRCTSSEHMNPTSEYNSQN